MSNEERAALEAFVVDNEDLELLESLLAEFNIFEALGAVWQELRHSDFLAFLLDPKGNHGLRDTFLKMLLKRVLLAADSQTVSPVQIDVADLSEAEVRREWQNIDILIRDENNRLIAAIENKVRSGERSGQLHGYRKIIHTEFPHERSALVYLTPEGERPSDETWLPCSYGQVADLVETISKSHASTLGTDVHTLLVHYSRMLRRHIVTDSEIADLCRRIYRRHKAALDMIIEHRPDLQADLAEVLRGLVESAASHGLELEAGGGKAGIKFAVTEWDKHAAQLSGRDWAPSNRILLFEFWNGPDTLKLVLLVGPGPQSVRQHIIRFAENRSDVFRLAFKTPGKKWTQLLNRRFLSRSDYEDADIQVLKDKVLARWEKFLKEDLPRVTGAFDQMQWPEPSAGS